MNQRPNISARCSLWHAHNNCGFPIWLAYEVTWVGSDNRCDIDIRPGKDVYTLVV